MKKYEIDIKGVGSVSVSEKEYEFVQKMKEHRQCNHWFNLGGYTVMIGDEITLIDPDDTDNRVL